MGIRGYFLSAIRNTQYDIRDAILFPAFFGFFNHGLHRFHWLSFLRNLSWAEPALSPFGYAQGKLRRMGRRSRNPLHRYCGQSKTTSSLIFFLLFPSLFYVSIKREVVVFFLIAPHLEVRWCLWNENPISCHCEACPLLSQGQACTRAGRCRPWQSHPSRFRLLRYPFDPFGYAQGKLLLAQGYG